MGVDVLDLFPEEEEPQANMPISHMGFTLPKRLSSEKCRESA